MIDLYVVRSKVGKFFRARGQSGYGESWVTDIQNAKVYGKIGPARAQVTYWATAHPKYGVPDILKLEVTGLEVLDETARVEKALGLIATAKEKIELVRAKQNWERAEAEYARAEENLRQAKKAREQS